MMLFIAVVVCMVLQVVCLVVQACVEFYVGYARIKFRLLGVTVLVLCVLLEYYDTELDHYTSVASDGVQNLTRTYNNMHAVAEWITYANSTVGTYF